MENSGTGTRWKTLAQAQGGKLWHRHKMEDKVHLFGETDGEMVYNVSVQRYLNCPVEGDHVEVVQQPNSGINNIDLGHLSILTMMMMMWGLMSSDVGLTY